MDAAATGALWICLTLGAGLVLLLAAVVWQAAVEKWTRVMGITRYVIAYYRHREMIRAWWADQEAKEKHDSPTR
jgi:hypothetical protein